MSEGVLSLMTTIFEKAADNEWSEEREYNLFDGGAPFYRTYECADGRYITVGALELKFYRLLCAEIGLEDEFDPENRADWQHIERRMAAIFRTRKRDEWAKQLEYSDACFSPVMTFAEAFDHPHFGARQSFIVADGRRQPGPVPRFSKNPPEGRRAARAPVEINLFMKSRLASRE